MPIVTGTPTTFAGFGKVEWAPTNAPDDPFPTWVDITPYVRTENNPMDATRVRQTELDTVQPSVFMVVLDNTDLRFTFGLLSGPYGSNWQPAKQIRWTDTIGSRTFQIFKGYLEAPDIINWADIGYQELSLSCTDRLTRLGRARPFVSTLGAQIVWAGGASLIDYYPLNEVAGPNVRDFTNLGQLVETTEGFSGTAIQDHLPVHYAAAPTIFADDLQGITYDPFLDIGGSGAAVRWHKHTGPVTPSFTVGAGDAVAVACWVNWTAATVNGPPVFVVGDKGNSVLQLQLNPATGVFNVFAQDNSGLSFVTLALSRPPTFGQWVLFAMRLTESTGLVEVWANADTPVTGTLGGTPSTFVASAVSIGGYANASFAHLQVYHGLNAYTRAQHLAQYQAGLTGLEWQSTGQRINTILDYAGVPTYDRSVDPGCSYMQRASLAGKDPGTALLDAVSTERGRGFAGGDGRYVFHDRTRIYNV